MTSHRPEDDRFLVGSHSEVQNYEVLFQEPARGRGSQAHRSVIADASRFLLMRE